LDTANTFSAVGVVGSNLEVTIVTPGGAPGVLNEEVVNIVLNAVADSKDGVVNSGSTFDGTGKDTSLVGTEVMGLGIK